MEDISYSHSLYSFLRICQVLQYGLVQQTLPSQENRNRDLHIHKDKALLRGTHP